MSIESEEVLHQDVITPQNLKDNETISKLMKIYHENLSSQVSITQNPTKLLDTNYLIDNMPTNSNYNNVKKELFQIHLNEIHKIFENVENSEEIYQKYKEIYNVLNVSTDTLKIDFDIGDEVDSEYITASSSFKSKKGTKAGFFFVNDIINKVNIDPMNADSFFKIDEGTDEDAFMPYNYTVKASMYEEVFKETVLPLSHPVGFNWHFLRLLYLSLTDYFGLIETTTVTGLSLSCDKGNSVDKEVIVKAGKDSNGNAISLSAYPTDGSAPANRINFGIPYNFAESSDQENRKKVVIDFLATNQYPITNEYDFKGKQQGYRLVRDYDGRVTIYQRQNPMQVVFENTNKDIFIEIEKAELQDPRQGKLTTYHKTVFTVDDKGSFVDGVKVIDSIRFSEYSIFNLKELRIKYSIKYGTPLSQSDDLEENRIWYTAVIPLGSKVISTDKKFFENINITAQDLLKYSTDYNGRVYEDRGYTCTLNYVLDKRYTITTDDGGEYIKNIRKQTKSTIENKDNSENTIQQTDEKDIGDNWARLDPNNGVINIGQTVPYIPIIDSVGSDNNIELFPIGGDNPINDQDKGINFSMSPDADFSSIRLGSNSGTPTIDHNGLFNYISPSSDYYTNNPDIVQKIRRNEAYFAPSTYKDLVDLGIARVSDSNVYSYENTSELDDNVRVLGGQGPNTPAIYERQNKDNLIYTAREYETQDHAILMTPAKYNESVKDPIYSKGILIDASGKNRGQFDGYAFLGDNTGNNTDADYEQNSIGNFVIGAYMDQEQGNDGLCINPHASIYILEDHNYDADPVNLQLNTNDCNSTDFYYGKLNSDDVNDDNVNLKGDYRTLSSISPYKVNEDGKDSFANEINSTDITYAPVEDSFYLRNADSKIGDGMIIGGTLDGTEETSENLFNIGGELAELLEQDDTVLAIKNGNNSYTILEVAEQLLIGDGTIGDSYIKAKAVTYTGRDEESFMNVGNFDIFSDEDNWAIGVYKNDGNDNYTLLEDHNQAAAG